jgi:hypothetical protein
MASPIYPLSLTVVALALALMAGGYLRLRRSQRRDKEALGERLKQLAGLVDALAAGTADAEHRYERLDRDQRDLRRRLDDLEEEQRAARPYDEAIRMVRQGATGRRLVEELGISAGEADLLIRLHGRRETDGAL